MAVIVDKLGKLLVEAKLITEQQLSEALATMKQAKGIGRLGSTLVKMGYVPEEQLLQFLAQQYRVSAVDLKMHQHIDPAIIKLVPLELVKKHMVLPLKRVGATLTVAMMDPTNIFALDDLKFRTNYTIEPVIAAESSLIEAIKKYYGGGAAAGGGEAKRASAAILQAKDYTLSDGQDSDDLSGLDRMDEGPIVDVEDFDKTVGDALDSVEVADSEQRLPQDGRIKLKLGPKRDIDFRVSTLPTLFGEKACLRLLDKASIEVDKDKLGFDDKQAADINAALACPYGMILVTGPTGSGKTVTLYSCLQALNKPDVNISTAEDPVEFNFMGINQVLVQPDIGLTFAAALKSFLRQDPDIILIGEIRDFETGEIAVKAAMTGHLVLASVHTNDAPSTINRLLNMGIEPFLVASSVILVIAQRLCRRICKDCKVPDPTVTPEILRMAGASKANEDDFAKMTPMKGKGCATCSNKGYKGRLALYQIMPITEDIRLAILRGASTDELRKMTLEQGVKTIRTSGITKVCQGITTLKEVEGVSIAE